MKKRLTNNLGLKIIAVIFAVMLWLVVVNISDPQTIVNINGIEVKPLNENVLGANQIYRITSGALETITIRGPRSIVEGLSASDFTATADLSKMSQVNAVPIDVEVENPTIRNAIEIIQKKNHSIVVEVEKLDTKYCRIEVAYKGQQEEGYVLGEPSLSDEVVKVTAPVSKLEDIETARVEVDVTDTSTKIKKKENVLLYDKSGAAIRMTNEISMNLEKVIVTIPMLLTKEVLVNYQTRGTVAQGYQLAGVESIANKVTIAGTKSKLSKISEITIPDTILNIQGAKKDVSVEVNLDQYLPEDVIIYGLDSSTVAVTAKIERLVTKSFSYTEENMDFLNVPEKYQVDTGNIGEIVVVIRGLKSVVDAVDAATLNPSFDLANAVRGNNVVALSVDLPDNVEIISSMNYTIRLLEENETKKKEDKTTKKGNEG